ncbi:MAG: CotH kinase family protein [Clostridia bacterium]|nr:CotH kinase family protein [Clostridia bacterium]
MSNSKTLGKRVLAVILTVMMLMSTLTIAMTASAANVDLAPTGANVPAGQTLYLNPNIWNKDGARFAMYGCNGTAAAEWVSMSPVPGDGSTFQGTFKTGPHTNVIFVRMNGSNQTNDWNNKWNQTANLTWDGAKSLFTVTSWDNQSSGWTDYTAPELPKAGDASDYYFMGTLSDWATGANMVYTDDIDVVTVTFKDVAAGNYEFKVKTGSTWYGVSQLGTTISPADGGKLSGSDNVTLAATGGDYTFNYKVSTGKLSIVYSAPVVETTTVPATTTVPVTTTVPATTTPVETSSVAAETDPVETTTAPATEPATTTPATTVPATTTTPVAETTTAPSTQPATTTPADVNIDLPWSKDSGLYAYAGTSVSSTSVNAWQRWHENGGKRYFLLAPTASDTEVIIYSTYTSDVKVNGVTIKPGEFEVVPYVDGTTYTCSGATTQSVKISKTDAEGVIYVNSKDGMVTVNDDSAETETERNASYDLFAFLTGGTKNREGAGVAGAVASAENGVNDAATIKKIKGRGNSTWSETKKPFNITYKDNIELDGMKGKKWSLLANAKDGSLLRNRLVYDMANEVEMTYACDSRFVDFYVNGYYKGSYQLTQKIEMGKNTVMPDLTEPEVEDVIDDETGETIEYPKTDFDFILELDTEENAASANDKGFNTKEGQWMTYKTPDDPATEQIAFIKAKYQAVEDALYGDNMAELEKLVDIEDFAKAYLINEVTKNIDAGVTSCYFTYNSTDGKFYASPVWDYDNSIGNLPDNGGRTDMSGKVLDLDSPAGWYARELKHYARNARSIFSEAWYNTSKTADGKKFSDIVLDVWNAEFAGLVDKLEGTADATGRLNTIDGYMSNLAKSGAFNTKADGAYVTADWKANKTSLTMYDYNAEKNTLSQTTKNYSASFEGEADYAGDWLISRLNWMAAQYASAEVDVPDNPDGYITLFFTNNWCFESQNAYYWGGSAESMEWPGVSMSFYKTNDDGEDVYSIAVPADIEGIIFNGISDIDHTTIRQTVDIKEGLVDRAGFYCKDEANGKINVGTYMMPVEETTTPVETSSSVVVTSSTPVETSSSAVATDPTETTSTPVETSSSVVATDPTETTTPVEDTTVTVPAKTTITLFFTNNWCFESQNAYFWGGSAESMEWPGVKMEYYGENSDGEDVYYIEVPADIDAIIFNGISDIDHKTIRQTVDIEEGLVDRAGFYCKDEANGKINVGTYMMPVEETTTPVETSSSVVVTSSTPVETSSSVVATDPTETTSTPVETSSSAVENTTSTPAIEDDVYVVTWADSDKYTVATDLDATAVKAGTDFTFTVTAAEGYKVAAVIADMTVIEAVDGTYTINVTKDTTILVITAEDTTVPEVMKFTVTFTDKDGNELDKQTVEYGKAATAPTAPTVEGYDFIGWSEDFDFVTKDITVKAQYNKIVTPPTPATTGTLKIELAGGSSFTISINGGVARPQGSTFTSTSVPVGATVTVVAKSTDDKEFLGWVNPATGFVASTDYEFTFTTSGNDFFKAMFNTKVEGVNMVSFYNDVTKQYLDMQYYAATDTISWPTVKPVQAGYDFTGWNMTAEEIAAELAAGKDVTVLPKWEKQLVYVTLDVVNGTVTAGEEKDGKYLANTKTTVKANAAAEGYAFAYWTLDGKVVTYNEEYSFYPKADAKLEAVFVEDGTAIDYKVLAEVSSFTATEYGQFGISWYVPEAQNNLTYKGAGIVAVKDNLYNESTFVHGTTDANVWDRTLNTDKANGSAVWTGPVYSGETWIAACWVQYTDNATGETAVVYSDLFTVTKE